MYIGHQAHIVHLQQHGKVPLFTAGRLVAAAAAKAVAVAGRRK